MASRLHSSKQAELMRTSDSPSSQGGFGQFVHTTADTKGCKVLQPAVSSALLLQKVSLTAFFHLSGNHAGRRSGGGGEKKRKPKKKKGEKNLQTSIRQKASVRRCRFQGAADFPARHLKSHINHLLCESDLNKKKGWRGGAGGVGGHFRRPETEPPT